MAYEITVHVFLNDSYGFINGSCGFNPLTHIGPLTGPKTECTQITWARKLVLYTGLCINGYNMKLKGLQKN